MSSIKLYHRLYSVVAQQYPNDNLVSLLTSVAQLPRGLFQKLMQRLRFRIKRIRVTRSSSHLLSMTALHTFQLLPELVHRPSDLFVALCERRNLLIQVGRLFVVLFSFILERLQFDLFVPDML